MLDSRAVAAATMIVLILLRSLQDPARQTDARVTPLPKLVLGESKKMTQNKTLSPIKVMALGGCGTGAREWSLKRALLPVSQDGVHGEILVPSQRDRRRNIFCIDYRVPLCIHIYGDARDVQY